MQQVADAISLQLLQWKRCCLGLQQFSVFSNVVDTELSSQMIQEVVLCTYLPLVLHCLLHSFTPKYVIDCAQQIADLSRHVSLNRIGQPDSRDFNREEAPGLRYFTSICISEILIQQEGFLAA